MAQDKKDLYVLFSGMFLFDWKNSTKTVDVYVPESGQFHRVGIPTDTSRSAYRPLSESQAGHQIGALSHFNPGSAKFDQDFDLVLDGKLLGLATNPKYHAKITLPWPEKTWSCQSHWVRADTYAESPYSPQLCTVKRNHVGEYRNPSAKHDAFAVSEIFVLRYPEVDPATLDESLALEVPGGQGLGVFSRENDLVMHPHDELFNELLVHSGSQKPPSFHPTSTPTDLGMDMPYLKHPFDVDIAKALPQLWLIPQLPLRTKWLSASGMGSCDAGHRCGDC